MTNDMPPSVYDRLAKQEQFIQRRETPKLFLEAIADYVEIIRDSEEMMPLISEDLEEPFWSWKQRIDDLKGRLNEVMDRIVGEFEEYCQENECSQVLVENIKGYREWREGNILSSGATAGETYINRILDSQDAAAALADIDLSGYRSRLKDLKDAVVEFDKQREVSAWGAWYYISEVYSSVKNPEERKLHLTEMAQYTGAYRALLRNDIYKVLEPNSPSRITHWALQKGMGGIREQFEQYLQRVHSVIVKASQNFSGSRIEIHHTNQNGLHFKPYNRNQSYDIKGKRLLFLKHIANTPGSPTPADELFVYYETHGLVSDNKRDINKTCKKKLGLKDDLIVRSTLGGYMINQKYILVFE